MFAVTALITLLAIAVSPDAASSDRGTARADDQDRPPHGGRRGFQGPLGSHGLQWRPHPFSRRPDRFRGTSYMPEGSRKRSETRIGLDRWIRLTLADGVASGPALDACVRCPESSSLNAM